MNSRSALFIGALAGIALLSQFVRASAATPAPAPHPCADAYHHQFDFWEGDWNVYATGTNNQVGTNTITREAGGCVLQEHWTGQGGSVGTSFNIYDAPGKRWHQTWVDNSGGLLLLDGAFRDGKMTLSGKTTARNGKPVMNRIEFTPNTDGTVRQLWTATRDGKKWVTLFDGTYKKKS